MLHGSWKDPRLLDRSLYCIEGGRHSKVNSPSLSGNPVTNYKSLNVMSIRVPSGPRPCMNHKSSLIRYRYDTPCLCVEIQYDRFGHFRKNFSTISCLYIHFSLTFCKVLLGNRGRLRPSVPYFDSTGPCNFRKQSRPHLPLTLAPFTIHTPFTPSTSCLRFSQNTQWVIP